MNTKRRTLVEIADDIVAALSIDRHSSSAALAEWQHETLERLLTNLEFFICYYTEVDHLYSRANQVALAESAKRIGALIASLQYELKNAPPMLGAYLFEPEQLRGKSLTIEQEEYYKEQTLAALSSFRVRLSRMRKDCEWCSQKPNTATGPEPNRAKKLSATIAFALVRHYTKHVPVGTPESPFPAVASLLHEAMTGVRNANVMRACQSLLELDKKQEREHEEFKARLEAEIRARMEEELLQKQYPEKEIQACLDNFSRLIRREEEEEKNQAPP